MKIDFSVGISFENGQIEYLYFPPIDTSKIKSERPFDSLVWRHRKLPIWKQSQADWGAWAQRSIPYCLVNLPLTSLNQYSFSFELEDWEGLNSLEKNRYRVAYLQSFFDMLEIDPSELKSEKRKVRK